MCFPLSNCRGSMPCVLPQCPTQPLVGHARLDEAVSTWRPAQPLANCRLTQQSPSSRDPPSHPAAPPEKNKIPPAAPHMSAGHECAGHAGAERGAPRRRDGRRLAQGLALHLLRPVLGGVPGGSHHREGAVARGAGPAGEQAQGGRAGGRAGGRPAGRAHCGTAHGAWAGWRAALGGAAGAAAAARIFHLLRRPPGFFQHGGAGPCA